MEKKLIRLGILYNTIAYILAMMNFILINDKSTITILILIFELSWIIFIRKKEILNPKKKKIIYMIQGWLLFPK